MDGTCDPASITKTSNGDTDGDLSGESVFSSGAEAGQGFAVASIVLPYLPFLMALLQSCSGW